MKNKRKFAIDELRFAFLTTFAGLIKNYGIDIGEEFISMLKSCLLAKRIVESFKVSAKEKKEIFKRIIDKYLEFKGTMKR